MKKFQFWVVALFFFSGVLSDWWAAPSSVAGEIPATLAGTDWELMSFQSMDDAIGTTRPDDPSSYTMRLNPDGTVALMLGCNRAMGTWSVETDGEKQSGRFLFGPLAATRALCPPPRLDEKIIADSKFVRSFLLRDDRLHLSLLADAGIYTWAKAKKQPAVIALAPEEGGPRNWRVTVDSLLNMRMQPSLAASVIARYPDGTLFDNLGCHNAEGRTWCDVQPFGGGPRGYVAAEYLMPAISPDGSVATGSDDSALRAGQKDFDATGEIPCAQTSGQPMTRCAFGVSRAGGGDATVMITRPDGRTRAIFFRRGRPVGADTSQADGYPEFRADKEADLNLIRVGDERYEIPDAVALGG